MVSKIFDKWSSEGVVVKDLGVRGYIYLRDELAPSSFGRQAGRKFGKEKIHIVERLVNKLTVTGHLKDTRVHKRISSRDTGKKQRTYRIVRKALERVEAKTSKNPLQVLVTAVENASPQEETTRIRQGGIIVHRSVDVAPSRRVNLALSFLSHGAGQRSFKKKASIDAALAEEIIAAANYDMKCYSINKREELERIAASAR